MHELRQHLQQVASTDLTVLLLGETGSGQGAAARVLHRWSRRSHGRFVAVNVGALPANLLDNELSGHERGAFTGAVAQRKGQRELAAGGTVLLDEIGDLPLESWTRLPHLLRERVYERLGGAH